MRPICGKCKTDGQPCIWPQPRPPQQPVNQPTRENSRAIDLRGETQVARATSLRPSNTDSTVRPDLSPAFAYDARRRPSQRLVRLSHSADRVRTCAGGCQLTFLYFTADSGQAEPPGRNTATASGLSHAETLNSTQGPGDSVVPRSSSNKLPQPLSLRASSLPPRPQTEREAQRSSSLTAPRTIIFDEVFENVRREDSQEKHFIVEFPHHSNKWYILRCDEHDLNFGEHPFSSARCHIHSEAHGHMPRTQENCILELGVPVLGCTSKRAEENNEAYKKVLNGGYKPKQGNTKSKSHKRRRRRSKYGSTDTGADQSGSRPAGLFKPFEGIVTPEPGEVYLGAQHKPGRMEPQWSLVVCLPLRNW